MEYKTFKKIVKEELELMLEEASFTSPSGEPVVAKSAAAQAYLQALSKQKKEIPAVSLVKPSDSSDKPDINPLVARNIKSRLLPKIADAVEKEFDSYFKSATAVPAAGVSSEDLKSDLEKIKLEFQKAVAVFFKDDLTSLTESKQTTGYKLLHSILKELNKYEIKNKK